MKVGSELEIRVAVIGHAAVGKSTAVNALLRSRFSEVARRRTTAGVNYLRVSSGATWAMLPEET